MRATSWGMLFALSLTACDGGPEGDDLATSETSGLTLTPAEAAGVLLLVNDCATTRDRMRGDAGVTSSAATAIADWRAGPDAACGTRDDRVFETIAGLDGVPGVGDATLRALLAFARAEGLVVDGDAPIGSFDGVLFTEAEARGALALANAADAAGLDADVGLDARAARNILAARPFRTDDLVQGLLALSRVPYVGADALEALKLHGGDFAGPPPPAEACQDLAGTWSGVVFTAIQAHDALDLVGRGASADLRAVPGIGAALAGRLEAARPYRTITDVDAVSGVGPALLKALRDAVATGWCRSAGARCGCAAVEPPAADVTLEGVTFPGALVPVALDILNRATRDQLHADGGFESAHAGGIVVGRPWASIRAYADSAGVGTVTLRVLVAFADSGLWQGPGPMRTAVTLGQILADRRRFPVGAIVSLERVLVRRTSVSVSALNMWVSDGPDAPQVLLTEFLCGHDSCWEAPDIRAGHGLRVVHTTVGADPGGRLTLRGRPSTRLTVIP